MSERIIFYGPVQGMVRIDNAQPKGEDESKDLAAYIKKHGCTGCPRLNAKDTPDVTRSYPCKGVTWVGLEGSYLYEHQGHPVYSSGLEKCQLLVNKRLDVPERLVTLKEPL